MELEHTPHVQVIPEDKSKTKKILRVALILAVITAIEFVIAFTVPEGAFRTLLFLVLTVVKAFYIVFEFMHLGHEKKSLKMSVLLPLMFILFLIFILMYQGAAIYHLIH